MSARPAGLIVVTGTSTGVGKTFFTAVTLGLLRARRDSRSPEARRVVR